MNDSLPGYDAWKLATPPEYDDEPEHQEQDPDDAMEAAREDAIFFRDNFADFEDDPW